MCNALLIRHSDKNANLLAGDIVGLYEDFHKFSEEEFNTFNVEVIKGTVEQITHQLDLVQINLSFVYKGKDIWTFSRPEEKVAWQDVDGVWYFFTAKLFCKWSMESLSDEDRSVLADGAPCVLRDSIFRKMIINPGIRTSANLVLVDGLNG